MSEKKKKVPVLRFPGFTDAWEQRKLETLMDFSNGINAPKENYGKGRKMVSVMDILSSGELGYENIRSSVEVESDVEERHKVENGDIVFARSSEIPEEVGWAKAYTDSKYALYSGFAIRGKKKSEYSSIFVERSLNGVGRKQIERKAGGSTRYNVSQGILNSIAIMMPNFEEQTQIGTFLKQIDNLIALHQRKLTHLQARKKGLLQKMFPKDGELFPELRFPGFTDAWEQRRLGDVGKTQSGIGFPDAEQGGIEGIPFFKVSDMNNDGNENEMLTANNYVSDEQLQRKKWNRLEDIPAVVFAKVGAAIMLNRKRIVRTPFLIDNNMMAYLFDHSWDVDFGKTLFETINLPRFAQIGALPSYNGSDIESIIIRMPTEEEQAKIGAFFKQLDDSITLHQRKLDHLQTRKKALLQQLFV